MLSIPCLQIIGTRLAAAPRMTWRGLLQHLARQSWSWLERASRGKLA